MCEKKGPITARSAHECVKRQSMKTYDTYEPYEVDEVGGGTITLYFAKKGQKTFSQPIHIGFKSYDSSIFLLYETHYDKLQPYFKKKILRTRYIDTNSAS